MPYRLKFEDVELVCAVLDRLDTTGRGGANIVATELGIARSVVSDRIGRVEEHFGSIFIAYGRGRTGRITDEGRVFMLRGRELLACYRRLRDDLGARTT